MKKYKSEAFKALHESMTDLYKAGGISDARMREYDAACLAQPAAAPVPRIANQKPVPARPRSPMYAQGT